MDKNIIIDGVNVAGCGAYKDKHCKDKTSIIFCDTNLCSNYPNCYYKQLKRLEQENKELKAYKDVNEDFKKAWDELNKKYTEVLKLAKENADSNEYCLQEMEKRNEQMTYALKRIRNLVQGHKIADEVRLKSILDKIQEVLNDK